MSVFLMTLLLGVAIGGYIMWKVRRNKKRPVI